MSADQAGRSWLPLTDYLDTALDQLPELGVTVRGQAVTDLLRPAYTAMGRVWRADEHGR